jgi:hypothetical protein
MWEDSHDGGYTHRKYCATTQGTSVVEIAVIELKFLKCNITKNATLHSVTAQKTPRPTHVSVLYFSHSKRFVCLNGVRPIA